MPVIGGINVIHVRDLITMSLRLITAVAAGEKPTAAESQDALDALNLMVDSWNADRLIIYNVVRNTKALTPTKQTYTLGTGGDLNIPRPPKVEKYGIVLPSGVKLPLDEVDEKGWQALPIDSATGSFPSVVWDDGGFPLRTLNFWPIPTSACSVDIYSWEALDSAMTLDTALSLPPSYLRAMKFNLAVEAAPEFDTEPSDVVVGIARESKAALMSMNLPNPLMRCEDAALGPDAGGSLEIASMFGIGFTK